MAVPDRSKAALDIFLDRRGADCLVSRSKLLLFVVVNPIRGYLLSAQGFEVLDYLVGAGKALFRPPQGRTSSSSVSPLIYLHFLLFNEELNNRQAPATGSLMKSVPSVVIFLRKQPRVLSLGMVSRRKSRLA